MVSKCNHNWKNIYFRKTDKKKGSQNWMKIPNKMICDKCLTIAELKGGDEDEQ